MNDPVQHQLSGEAAILLDYVERLNKFRADRQAIHIHLSRLAAYNQRSHHLRIASTAFEMLVRSYEGAQFQLFNNDLVVICKGATIAKIDEYVLRLRFLFSEDPLFAGDETGDDEFCTWYDVEKDYAALLGLVKDLVETRAQYEAERAIAGLVEEKTDEAPATPLDPSHLSTIIKSITQADLSGMMRRQPICAVAKGEPPRPLFHEVYISIDALRQTLMPNHDLTADHWLFQTLARYLDRRMISLLSKNDDQTLNQAFSLNLSVETLLSPEFLELDEALNEHTRRTIIVEIQMIDVFADLSSFMFARDFLHDRGYRVCLDGVTHMSLPLVDRKQLKVDLIKLQWNEDLRDHLQGKGGEALRQAVARQSAERLILNRCDSEAAIEVGRSLGIGLFQGHLLDKWVSDGVSPEETVRRLSEAKARHRAAGRAGPEKPKSQLF